MINFAINIMHAEDLVLGARTSADTVAIKFVWSTYETGT